MRFFLAGRQRFCQPARLDFLGRQGLPKWESKESRKGTVTGLRTFDECAAAGHCRHLREGEEGSWLADVLSELLI